MIRNSPRRYAIVFPAQKDFADYCDRHKMRQDTSWQIVSTGESGIGPKNPNEARLTTDQIRHARENAGPFNGRVLPSHILDFLEEETAPNPDRGKFTGDPHDRDALMRYFMDFPAERAKRKIHEMLSTDTPGKFRSMRMDGHISEAFRAQMEKAESFLSTHVSKDFLANTEILVRPYPASHRSEARMILWKFNEMGEPVFCDSRRMLTSKNPFTELAIGNRFSASAFVHEMGHALENSNAELQELCFDFFKERTRDSIVQQIPGYPPEELCKKDHFTKEYVGKICPKRFNLKTARLERGVFPAEILSMGLESLYEDPIKFYKDDPGFFKFIVFALKLVR